MKIERLGAPVPEISPANRYARLHRAVESGMDTEATHAELVEVCLELGDHGEALSAFERVHSPGLQRRLERKLVRAGVIEEDRSRHPVIHRVELHTGVGDMITDAGRFLILDHMALVVIVATLTFPLVVGICGFMVAGTPSIVLPLLALLPGLAVLCLVGAMASRVIRSAADGLDDPPELPSVRELVAEAWVFFQDFGLLAAMLIGPGIALAAFGAPLAAVLPALALGALPLPMAFTMRQFRGDWSCLRPAELLGAIWRGGRDYLAVVGVVAATFVPAVLVGLATLGTQLYLQIALIGPMAVAPLIFSSRLLGNFLHEHRKDLSDVMRRRRGRARIETLGVRQPRQRRVTDDPRRLPDRVRPSQAPRTAPRAPRRDAAEHGAGEPMPAPATAAGRRTRVQVEEVRSPGTRGEGPDLSAFPGARVLRGDERLRFGAGR